MTFVSSGDRRRVPIDRQGEGSSWVGSRATIIYTQVDVTGVRYPAIHESRS